MTFEATNSSIGVEIFTPDILTPRLALIAITLEMIRAGFAKSPDFARLGQQRNFPPTGLPPIGTITPQRICRRQNDAFTPTHTMWGRYIATKPLARGERRILIGTCGATLPIELNDDPEIGYGILPAYQRHGYATEAVAKADRMDLLPSARALGQRTDLPPLAAIAAGARQERIPSSVGPGPGPEEGTVLL